MMLALADSLEMVDRLHREGAVLSEDRRFRYALSRGSDLFALPKLGMQLRYCAFCLLNPSTASETLDDPTVRKCRGFAQRWGFNRYNIINLFALRATDPRNLRKAAAAGDDAENDRWITAIARHAEILVVGWGNDGALRNRGQRVRAMLQGAGIPLHCWGITKMDEPRHPLYTRYDQPLELVPVRGVA